MSDDAALWRAIESETGVSCAAILSRDRTASVAFARRVAALTLRAMCWSYPAIARELGGRDHTTIMRLCLATSDRRTWVPKINRNILPRAQATAEAVLRACQGNAPTMPDRVTTDTGHAEWDAARRAYFAAPVGGRAAVWRDLCREMFPWSWRAQAAMPPRG